MTETVQLAVVAAIAAMVGSILAALPAIIIAIRTQQKVAEVHALANSMKDELVRVTRTDALQEGRTAGITEQKARSADIAAAVEKDRASEANP